VAVAGGRDLPHIVAKVASLSKIKETKGNGPTMAHALLDDNATTKPPTQASVVDLLQEARQGEANALGKLLQTYRNYLTLLASTQLNGRLRRRMNPSDLVQDAMLAAHRDFHQFRGRSEPELAAWLRQILIHCLHHAVETHVKAKMRDVRCEVSIEQFGRFLADPGPSPSAAVRHRESVVAFADRLAKLRPPYRDVIVLRGLQGLSFDEVAQRMERKTGTVRMLWLRAIEKLNQIRQEEEA
jgi:RNA polymerase sigma-70 factor (ECF subfamily)